MQGWIRMNVPIGKRSFLFILFYLWSLYLCLTPSFSTCSNNCKTSIFDYHRSCLNCSYDLCLVCCSEIRKGFLQGGEIEVIMEYIDIPYDLEYLHGKKFDKKLRGGKENVSISSENKVSSVPEWKANEDGTIPCPPKLIGGCGESLLELRCMFPGDWVSQLVNKAEEFMKLFDITESLEASGYKCSCFTPDGLVDLSSGNLRKAASHEDTNDNYLYCPKARDLRFEDLQHFQSHWARGEPVLVSNVLETTSGLSWEPMVMWRAFRQISNTNHSRHLDVTAIDCLDLSEVRFLAITLWLAVSNAYYRKLLFSPSQTCCKKQYLFLMLVVWSFWEFHQVFAIISSHLSSSRSCSQKKQFIWLIDCKSWIFGCVKLLLFPDASLENIKK